MFGKIKKNVQDLKQIKSNKYYSKNQKWQLIRTYLRISWLSLWHGRLTTVTEVSLLGYQVQVQNMSEFVNLFDEVIVSDFYRTQLAEPPQLIYDAGANMGFSTIYFRWLYPEAKLICFEPDPDTFTLLKKNLGNDDGFITLHNVALSDQSGTVPFYRRHDLSIASTTSPVNADKSERIDVIAQPLSTFVDSKIDILKMDIERMETQVFKEMLAAGAMKNVQTFAMEYHYDYADADNKLSELLEVFEQAEFVYTISLLSDKLPQYKTYRIEGRQASESK